MIDKDKVWAHTGIQHVIQLGMLKKKYAQGKYLFSQSVKSVFMDNVIFAPNTHA